ncbi:M23 family metallopeptidase [Lutimonas zeaxanthinifaciens]|uniref:M23 family metallopeptidase n=1 Tax=Lutimonas zeaxanthinifaciens TaxID=3060215 RepID=UPI00265CBD0D|nr:M23 family metallopeptidase [Lutimonas sp. YSD2104]WKK64697.1 M23 family metallopeptidase [Lutimonas sp. YSD2104]
MRKKIVLLLLLAISQKIASQAEYPKDYFINPLEIPMVLSGTFGELRSNHFHAGLDIKTQQVEGHKVVASADGYVSRINVSLWGYGNALYVTHPNGYTTVYGHLQKFSPEIDAYVRKKQYENERFSIRLYPKSKDLIVKKGQIIALSGNSGSSGGPHLHYEIRDVKSRTMNPMLFGITVPDHKNPTIQNAYAYSLTDTSHVNQSANSVKIVFNRQYDGDLLANKIYAYGKIGFGINAYDRLDGALNRNGLYILEMSVNGERVFQFAADKFSFDESRFINSYIDYDKYINQKQRVQKCFVDHDMNNLSLYKRINDSGYINVKDSMEYTVSIIARDFTGNKTKLIIPIQGKKDSVIIPKKVEVTDHYFKSKQSNTIKDSIITAYFPENIFYEDFYFDYSFENGVVKLHDSSVPVHKNFRLTFDVSSYNMEDVKKMYIAKKNKYGKLNYVSTKRKDNTLYTLSRYLGEFTLTSDNQNPTIKTIGFADGQWLTKFKTLKVRIHDKGSGIKSYRGEIDGQWIRMAYNPKKGILTYDFSDKNLEGTLHNLKVVVTDNVNNSTTFTTTFNKKN